MEGRPPQTAILVQRTIVLQLATLTHKRTILVFGTTAPANDDGSRNQQFSREEQFSCNWQLSHTHIVPSHLSLTSRARSQLVRLGSRPSRVGPHLGSASSSKQCSQLIVSLVSGSGASRNGG